MQGKRTNRWKLLSKMPIESPPVAFSVENPRGIQRVHLLRLTNSEHYGKQRHGVRHEDRKRNRRFAEDGRGEAKLIVASIEFAVRASLARKNTSRRSFVHSILRQGFSPSLTALGDGEDAGYIKASLVQFGDGAWTMKIGTERLGDGIEGKHCGILGTPVRLGNRLLEKKKYKMNTRFPECDLLIIDCNWRSVQMARMGVRPSCRQTGLMETSSVLVAG